MAFTASALNSAIGAVTARCNQISLHSADPGTTGINEVSGGSPAYARKVPTWGAASAGSSSDSATPQVFDVPAGTTVAFVGYWDSTGPTFLGSDPVTSETFGAQGQYSLDSATLSIS